MAAWAIGKTDRFKAAMKNAGISDWRMRVATGDCGALDAALGGSSGWESSGSHRHDQLSPISYASQMRTPVLIVHGEDDTNVPLSQATYLRRALSRFGVFGIRAGRGRTAGTFRLAVASGLPQGADRDRAQARAEGKVWVPV